MLFTSVILFQPEIYYLISIFGEAGFGPSQIGFLRCIRGDRPGAVLFMFMAYSPKN
jgi:hypothetical protein